MLLRVALGSAGASAAVGVSTSYYLSHRYTYEPEFRQYLRSSRPAFAANLESQMQTFWPSAVKQVRIEDEIEQDPLDPSTCVQIPENFNLGTLQTPKELTDGGARMYSRLLVAPIDDDKPVSTESEASDSQVGDAVNLIHNTFSTAKVANERDSMIEIDSIPEPIPNASLNELDGTSVVDRYDEVHDALEDPRSGLTWSVMGIFDGNHEGVTSQWSSTRPCELPREIDVPVEAADKFHALLSARSGCMEVSIPSSSVSHPEQIGFRKIMMPDDLRDWDEDDNMRSTDPVDYLQRLRIHKAYAEAEYSSLNVAVCELRRQTGHRSGGGLGILRMEARLRQLNWKIKSIEEEKSFVKRFLLDS